MCHETYTTMCKVDSHQEFAVWLGELGKGLKTMKFSRAEPTVFLRAAVLSSRIRIEAQVKGLVAGASRARCPLPSGPHRPPSPPSISSSG